MTIIVELFRYFPIVDFVLNHIVPGNTSLNMEYSNKSRIGAVGSFLLIFLLLRSIYIKYLNRNKSSVDKKCFERIDKCLELTLLCFVHVDDL